MTALVGLENKYQLSREILSDWKASPIPDFNKPFVLRVSLEALCTAIEQRIRPMIDFSVKICRGTDQLNQSVTKRKLTPLHVAAIADFFEAAEKLLEAGASPNVPDIQGWTPLHHAALLGHKQMVELLIAKGAHRNAKNLMGGTYQDILNLTQSTAQIPNDPIPLIWDAEQRLLTQSEFQRKTGAVFIEENRLPANQIWDVWNAPFKALKDDFPFTAGIAQQFEKFAGNIHVLKPVAQDADGKKLTKSPGLGLFAKREFAGEEIIGEYQGLFRPENDLFNPYMLDRMEGGKVDSEKFRNEIPHINDGFINVIMVPIYRARGLPSRYLFVAAEPIAAGSQFCWNYGFQRFKVVTPYLELRPCEVRKFIKSHSIRDLGRLLDLSLSTGQMNFAEYVIAEKFRYILDTPSVLFSIIFDGILNEVDARMVQRMAWNRITELNPGAPGSLQNIADTALECRKTGQRLKGKFPNTASAYIEYFASLNERVKISLGILLAAKINEAVASQYDLMRDDASFHQYWQNVIMPRNERAIAQFGAPETQNR